MRLNNKVLILDTKVTDKFRKWFAGVGQDIEQLAATCVILGDSDLDYEMAPNVDQSRILSSPYNPNGIKYKLIYNGVGKNLSGLVKCFARKVLSTGDIQSLYNYPNDEVWSTNAIPPTLQNGKDWEVITFNDSKMGYILYFSTVLDYYFDDNGVKKRLVEQYDFTFDWNGTQSTPSNWDYVVDNTNGSILLSKQDTTSSPIGLLYGGKITAVGQFSKKIKEINFNF